MSVATLMLYGVTWLFVALTPGPAVMCVASQAARYGWRAACLGVLVVQVGNIAFVRLLSVRAVRLGGDGDERPNDPATRRRGLSLVFRDRPTAPRPASHKREGDGFELELAVPSRCFP